MVLTVLIVWPLHLKVIGNYLIEPSTDLIDNVKVISSHVTAFYALLGVLESEKGHEENIIA